MAISNVARSISSQNLVNWVLVQCGGRTNQTHHETGISILLSTSEQRVLGTFRKSLLTPGEMLCFSGPNLEQDRSTLDQMSDKELLLKEKFKGGYSLTPAGFAAMKSCE